MLFYFLCPFLFLLFFLSFEYPALVMWIDTKSEDEVSWVHATNCFGWLSHFLFSLGDGLIFFFPVHHSAVTQ